MWRVDFSHGTHKIEFIMDFLSRWSRLSLFDITALYAYMHIRTANRTISMVWLCWILIIGSAAHRFPLPRFLLFSLTIAPSPLQNMQVKQLFNNIIRTGQWGWQNNAYSSTSQLKCQQLNHPYMYIYTWIAAIKLIDCITSNRIEWQRLKE